MIIDLLLITNILWEKYWIFMINNKKNLKNKRKINKNQHFILIKTIIILVNH